MFDLLGPEFTVLGPAESARPLLEAAAQLKVPMFHVDPGEHGFAAIAGPDVVLVRPDQHIAWVGRSATDAHAVIDAALLGFTS